MSAAPSRNLVSIGPSVLSADFLRLGEQLREIRSCRCRVRSFRRDGWPVRSQHLDWRRRCWRQPAGERALPIDVHLMVTEPERWIQPFRDAGCRFNHVSRRGCGTFPQCCPGNRGVRGGGRCGHQSRHSALRNRGIDPVRRPNTGDDGQPRLRRTIVHRIGAVQG